MRAFPGLSRRRRFASDEATVPIEARTYRHPPLEVRFCLPGSARRREVGTLRGFGETTETLELKNLEILEFGNSTIVIVDLRSPHASIGIPFCQKKKHEIRS